MKYIITSQSIGENIQKMRKKRNWNQTKLGQELYVNQATISRIESGHPSKTISLKKIAEVLNCKIEDLIETEDVFMLKEIAMPETKKYEIPGYDKHGLFVEVTVEKEGDSTVVYSWLCKESGGIKDMMFGLPLEQADKTYTYEEVLDIIESNLLNTNDIPYYLDRYYPETFERDLQAIKEACGVDLEMTVSVGCPFCAHEH